MRVSWKWLNELAEFDSNPEELASLLTMSGIEVEGIESLEKGIKHVKVGLITEITDHPHADKLCICHIKIDEGQMLTIVTGATNVRPGQKVPVALVGAVLPGGKKIKEAKLRGVESSGMLCSAQELGLDADKVPAEQKDGIYILPADVPVGANIIDVLELDDVVLELGLTPNRSDCMGMINVAREVAALTGGKINLPHIKKSEQGGSCAELIKIDIEDSKLSQRYVGRIIKDVHIAPSPLWLQHRLMAAGVRPINNIVDVTNYVMMETGQPLHAFDYDTLKGKYIKVRNAAPGEVMVTLDGQQRELTPDMLVIADAERPVALAGVMGGLDTEVTGNTKTILLEAAYFNGASIRRTSLNLGLRSEASLRFEKSVDLEQVNLVADRAIQLMEELGAGKAVDGHVDCYPAPEKKEPISLRLSRINEILGTELTEQMVEDYLTALNMDITLVEKGKWSVKIPSYRRDITGEVDLIEEVARLYGYDNIPTTLPCGESTQGRKTREQKLDYRLRSELAAQGMTEIITYSFINPRHLDWVQIPANHELRETVKIKNPLSEEQGIMRTLLLPGLLDAVQTNLNKRNKNLKLFEVGKVYNSAGFPSDNKLPQEKWTLGCIATGNKEKSWRYGEEEYDFYYLKGSIENLFETLRIDDYVFVKSQELPWLHPGRTATIEVKGKEVGYIGEVHPLVLENYEIEQKVVAVQLDLDLLMETAQDKLSYKSIGKFPAVTRDLAVVVPEEVEARSVEKLIASVGKKLLVRIKLFDVYRGKQIAEGHKSLAFSLSWQAPDKTLTDEEVNNYHKNIEQVLDKEFGGDIRRV